MHFGGKGKTWSFDGCVLNKMRSLLNLSKLNFSQRHVHIQAHDARSYLVILNHSSNCRLWNAWSYVFTKCFIGPFISFIYKLANTTLDVNWRKTKSVWAVSKIIWHMLQLYGPSLHLGDLLSPVKSLEGEQSAVLEFYAGALNAHVGQIKRPRPKCSNNTNVRTCLRLCQIF